MSLATYLPSIRSPLAPGAIVGHGSEKFPIGRLLGSSAARNWSGVAAERWFHPAGDLPAFVPACAEVALLVRGPSTVTRRAAGSYQRTKAVPGTVWLCPAGLCEDFISVSADIAEVLHLYLPAQPFATLAKDYGSRGFGAASLRYKAGFRDPLLQAIAAAMLSELQAETSTGRLLAETLACSLAVRLLQNHSDIPLHLPLDSPETALILVVCDASSNSSRRICGAISVSRIWRRRLRSAVSILRGRSRPQPEKRRASTSANDDCSLRNHFW
jgi:hypothetical protein